ncbi:NnrS family protein [Rhodoferax lacus]|uniref:NnrS family protein n=1 Tax=Rhodoferax lacus TaxID=2184758 RepID=A0A3E1RD97_9BURK|nr:NnrS family protein [Rhodoferax lacus]RFO97338.1 NnrS family protein [Rhodoferax lacus]
MATLISIREAPRPGQPPAFALWALGFRPFYLLASGFAALSIALWALQFAGLLGHAYLQGPLWHAHEMLFGFSLAVLVGFLFTAGRNWSGQATPTGAPLAALAALWVAGRVLVLTPWGWVALVVNTAFPLAAAVGLGLAFYKGRNTRNFFFVGLLVLMGLAELCVHLNVLGVLPVPAWAGIGLALDVMLFVLCVMAGRVLPMFTNNGVPGAKAVRIPQLEKAALGLVLALLLADVLQIKGLPLALLAVVGAGAHLARWLRWQPWKTLHNPLVWVLHLAYAWIPLHLLLRAAAELGWVGASAATHALTAGAIGGMVMGMITRTALGHTGRALRAGRVEVTCYALVALAAVVRVAVPLLAPGLTVGAVELSALLWSAGFGLYTVAYWPILSRARSDGLPG